MLAWVKWLLILSIVGILAKGVHFVYEYHLDQIDTAVNAAKIALVFEQNEVQKVREEELREISRKDKEKIEVKLKAERTKVSNLQRMLLIDHDLDRLLQRKPGLILTRVNKGTEAYFKALEEATQ